MLSFQSSDLSTSSKEVPGAASRLKHFPKLVSVNIGGLTAFKCSYVQKFKITANGERQSGFKKVVFSKLPEECEGRSDFPV
eukprot:snap_masked-scaffold_64-processed-gene-0.45-mRNA-1 protein AED:1.00 eAED:1.00 QI:0/-1/0/0/-1/1/1/0/80